VILPIFRRHPVKRFNPLSEVNDEVQTSVKQSWQRYSDEFKEQALRRAEQDGVATVAKDLKNCQPANSMPGAPRLATVASKRW
jgi:hypothetical protein